MACRNSPLLPFFNATSFWAWTVFLPLLAICYVIYFRYATSLRKVPGPFFASFTRLWKLRKTLKGDFERTNIDLHRRYGELQRAQQNETTLTLYSGPIVRIGPNEVSIDDPEESLSAIYGHGTKFIKV